MAGIVASVDELRVKGSWRGQDWRGGEVKGGGVKGGGEIRPWHGGGRAIKATVLEF